MRMPALPKKDKKKLKASKFVGLVKRLFMKRENFKIPKRKT